MKIAILGSAGHYGLVAEAAGAEAAGAEATGAAAASPEAGGTGVPGPVPEPLEYVLAPIATGEDMAPVARLLAAAPAGAATTPRILDDWRALLDREKPDAAVVNPPYHLIGSVTRECLLRGIHVLAEKPLATEWPDLEAIRGLWRSGAAIHPGNPGNPGTSDSPGSSGSPGVPGGPKLMAMLTMRYDGAFRAAKRLVAGGAVGTPILFTAQKSYPPEGWDGGPRPGFYRKRAGYGGTIPWVGIHVIDLFSWFSGSGFSEVAAAHTLLGNGGMEEMESASVLQFKLASGAVASANLDFLRRRPADGGAAGRRAAPWGDDRLRVAGDRGTLEVRDGRVRVEDADGIRWVDPDPPASLFADFLAWISGGADMPLTAEDCLRASEAALHARDAADQGRVLAF